MTDTEAVNIVHSGGTLRAGAILPDDYEKLRCALLVYSCQMQDRRDVERARRAWGEVKRLDKALGYNPKWRTEAPTGEVGYSVRGVK